MTKEEKCQIDTFAKCGWSARKIANELNRSPSTISKYLRRKKETGKTCRQAGSGRPRDWSEKYERRLRRLIIRNRKLSLEEIKAELGVNLSTRTLSNRLSAAGFRSVLQKKKPFISAKNRKARIEWCLAHRSWSDEAWDSVLWSDESLFYARYKGAQRVWLRPEERSIPESMTGTVKHGRKVMVWGCFSSRGAGLLYRVQGNMEKYQFNMVLREFMLPSAEALFGGETYWFQQDNDPKHTAKINKQLLADQQNNGNLLVLPWPAQSPDINPIENLWAILDRRLAARSTNTEEELFEVLDEGWSDIGRDLKLLQTLSRSMPRRIEAVLNADGYPTKY